MPYQMIESPMITEEDTWAFGSSFARGESLSIPCPDFWRKFRYIAPRQTYPHPFALSPADPDRVSLDTLTARPPDFDCDKGSTDVLRSPLHTTRGLLLFLLTQDPLNSTQHE